MHGRVMAYGAYAIHMQQQIGHGDGHMWDGREYVGHGDCDVWGI